MTSTGHTSVWPLPWHVEKIEILDGRAVAYGAAGNVLFSISLDAVRRLLDASVLDAFIGPATP